MVSVDRSAVIFGNVLDEADYRAACKNREKYVRKFGDDSAEPYPLAAVPAPVIGERFGVQQLVSVNAGTEACSRGAGDTPSTNSEPPREQTSVPAFTPSPITAPNPVIIGTIRMGFGHYRIGMAMASAAHALGCTPYWMNLMGYPDTTCSKIISAQNDLYSMGSRISQKSKLFNAVVWEPINYEGFRKLSYNASDQKAAELMVRPFRSLPKDVPFIGCHAWPAQAAIHAGMQRVVNAIPDNWPMALHLSEGAIHAVQTPNAFDGYKMLRGMQKGRVLKPMPEGSLVDTGHYVDHELVAGIEADCGARERRREAGEPVRFLLSIGGAGAQYNLFRAIIEHALTLISAGQASLWVNVGDHRNVWEKLVADVPALAAATCHFDDFAETEAFATTALTGPVTGVHAFFHSDIFGAVYSTNLLMRACDFLMTKPSELSFYPVPKLMIQRVGGHEQWGAVRAAEVGDGTYELRDVEEILGAMDLVCASPELLLSMCANIRRAKAVGIYDGAYRVVKLALVV